MSPLESVQVESRRRMQLWDELRAGGGPNDVRPKLVKRLGLHLGQQGVFRDLERTRGLGGSSAGVAVGLLHTGRVYSDDLSESGLVYHYPDTVRGRRDANEVASIQACREFGLPLFVIITPSPKSPFRNVRLGWVIDSDDLANALLIGFGETPPQSEVVPEREGFDLIVKRAQRRALTKVRPNQWRFRFDVVKRYGSVCAVCPIDDPNLLDAAHLCPVEAGGSDDARNGLVFCLNHHRAFDRGLLRIDPHELTVHASPAVGTARASIRHLANLPHPRAMSWAWDRFA